MHRTPSSRPAEALAMEAKASLLSKRATEPYVIPPPPGCAPRPAEPALAADRQALAAQRFFDELYVSAAPGLVQQAYVLTGCRRLAFESAEHAFRRAWERWPEVERDPDAVGWVRARAHGYALSPWHRLRRPFAATPGPVPTDPVHRALLTLPPWQRRAVLLCDGLGLSEAEAAFETEATTAATAVRLRKARAVLDPPLPGNLRDAVRARMKDASVATIAPPWSVRGASELRVRNQTRAVYAATAVLIALITVTIATSPARGEPADSHRPQRHAVFTEPRNVLPAAHHPCTAAPSPHFNRQAPRPAPSCERHH